MGVAMGTSLKIRDDSTPLELRRWARKEARGWPAARADIFTAVCPATGEDVTLVLPTVKAKVMDPFLSPLRRHPARRRTRRHGPRRRRLARPPRASRSRTTSRWRPCHPTVPNSTRSSGSGSICASASSRSASSTTPKPSSRPAAKPGMPSPKSLIVSDPSAPILGSYWSVHRLSGISQPHAAPRRDPV